MQTAPPNKSYQDRWPTAKPAFDRELQAVAEYAAAQRRQLADEAERAKRNLDRARQEYRAACEADEAAWEESHRG